MLQVQINTTNIFIFFTMENFGDRLRDLRKKKGMSLEDLANIFEIGKSATSSWELGKSKPNSDDLVKLASILETSPNYLLLGHDEKYYEMLERENELLKETLSVYRRAEKAEKQLEETKNIKDVSFKDGIDVIIP